MDEYLVTWRKFDIKAKVHWWQGRLDRFTFYIEKSPDHFFSVSQAGVEKLLEPWDRFNTLREAKEWIDSYCMGTNEERVQVLAA